MAIKPVSGEIKAQVLNDNLSYLDSETTKATNAAGIATNKAEIASREVGLMAGSKADKTFVESQLSMISTGAPRGYYSSVTALKTNHPNGAEGIYITWDTMTMYFWSVAGNNWTVLGPYIATEQQQIDTQMPILMFDNGGMMTTDFNKNQINLPAGNFIHGDKLIPFTAQVVNYEAPGTSERFLLYFNKNTRKFRVLWRSNMSSVIKYEESLVGTANPQTRTWYINASNIANPSSFENIRLDGLTPIIYQRENVEVTTNRGTGASYELTLAVPAGTEIYVGSNYYNVITSSIKKTFFNTDEACYVYFNIITKSVELKRWNEVIAKDLAVGTLLIDRLSLTDKKSSGNLMYLFDGTPIGQSKNDDGYEIDNVTLSEKPFFKEEYTNVVARFKETLESYDVTFGIITDTHVLNKNSQLKENFCHLKNFSSVTNLAQVDYSLHLGDISDGNNDKTKTEKELVLAMSLLSESPGLKLALRGNHDNNFMSARNNPTQIIPRKKLYNLIEKNYEKNFYSQPSDKKIGAFAHKNVDKKLILIALNSFDYASDTIDAIEQHGYGKEQISWLVNILKKVPADYSVIIICHNGFSGTSIGTLDSTVTNQKTIRDIIEAFQNASNVNYTASDLPSLNKNYYETSGAVDFSGKSTNRVIAVFSGHWHWDKSVLINGVRHICIASSLIDATHNGVQRDYNTYTEDSFKLVAIDRLANKIKLTGFGGNVLDYQEYPFNALNYVYDPDDNADGVIDEEMFNQLSSIVQDYKSGSLGGTGISFEKI